MTVSWFSIEDLGSLVTRHRVDHSVTKAINRIIRADLVIVDGIGMPPMSHDAAEGFYRLVDAAYERRALAISSNLHPSGSTSSCLKPWPPPPSTGYCTTHTSSSQAVTPTDANHPETDHRPPLGKTVAASGENSLTIDKRAGTRGSRPSLPPEDHVGTGNRTNSPGDEARIHIGHSRPFTRWAAYRACRSRYRRLGPTPVLLRRPGRYPRGWTVHTRLECECARTSHGRQVVTAIMSALDAQTVTVPAPLRPTPCCPAWPRA